MWSIAKRELRFYFSQLTGYLLVGSYLLITALFLWFFNTPYHLLYTELGDFNSFFEFTPLLFLLLIPALSMRTFAEESSKGTLEILLTKPLSPATIFGGKLLGVFFILCIAILPTLLHAFALESLLQEDSRLDWGMLFSSYFALLLLALLFIVSSLCASLLFNNQITALLAGILGCFIHFYLWSFLADFTSITWLYRGINSLGAQLHYRSLSRGVLFLEDLIYFAGFISVFFYFGVELIQNKKR